MRRCCPGSRWRRSGSAPCTAWHRLWARFFPIPHGVVCGTLVAAATAVNIRVLREREPRNPALARYARLGRLLTGEALPDDADAGDALVALLEAWTGQLDLPALDRLGVKSEDHPRIVAASRGSSMKTNPIVLEDEEIAAILEARQTERRVPSGPLA
jgi:alcohol dehydrogenase class IV